MNTTLRTCRFCRSRLTEIMVDLGVSPIANALIPENNADEPEMMYPLTVYLCSSCYLAQLPNTVSREVIFNDHYTYFSSYSTSWLAHAKTYAQMAQQKYELNAQSLVVELASNDGYLLRYFADRSIPVLGVDPSANVAGVAIEKGIPTRIAFFGKQEAQKMRGEGIRADLVVANNVLAHVPDIVDFISGVSDILTPEGVFTAEFPHLVNLIEKIQFDTIYHEHYSYFLFSTMEAILSAYGLSVFHVEKLPTHGGSLRIHAQKKSGTRGINPSVHTVRSYEERNGFRTPVPYQLFSDRVMRIKRDTLTFLAQKREKGAHIVGFGAAAKGNTFLNYCGIRTDMMDYVVDTSPHKQNHFLPGTRIPVYAPSRIRETKPDYIFILPWNLRSEISALLEDRHTWGGKCVVAIPELAVF